MRLLKSLATHLFHHERIQTTLARGKELVRFADKTITLAKRTTSTDSRLKVFENVTVFSS
jgi:ribosomal protein L17